MKKSRYYVPFILACFAISCQEDIVQSEAPADAIKVTDGRLHFPSEESFDKTLDEIQSGAVTVEAGRLKGLAYNSLLNTSPAQDATGDEFSIMDLKGYQVLLNAKREVQIGDYVVVISNDESKIFDLKGELKNVVQNETSYYSASTKSFMTRQEGNAKLANFNTWYKDELGLDISGRRPQCHWRWIRKRHGVFTIKYDYYHEGKYYANWLDANPTVVYGFLWEASDCGNCSEQPSSDNDPMTYNVSGVVYHCGRNSKSHEEDIVWPWLRAQFKIKLSAQHAGYSVYHLDDLVI